jgi:hypothetical protein
MAKTRENNFKSLVGGFTTNFNGIEIPKITADIILQAGLYGEVFRVYKSLGGILDQAPLRYGDFDFIVDGKIIELDEEAHFNRYRELTLTSKIYQGEHYFDVSKYTKHCKMYEAACLKGRSFGGYWTNDSTEKQFGVANSNGDLTGNGSPRWKQRAFYDFLKDFIPILFKTPVIRLSIYDLLSDGSGYTYTINQILEQNDRTRARLIYEKIQSYQ